MTVSRFFRIAAAILAVGSSVAWFVLGKNLGWTKTNVTKWVKDPVTEIDGPVIEKRFQPGVEILAATLGASALLWGCSFLKSKSNDRNHSG